MSRPEPKCLGFADFRVQALLMEMPGRLIAPAQIVNSVGIDDKATSLGRKYTIRA
jgi:hypothetical protein